MKCLLIAIGSAGDVHPMIGIGRAMAARGHDVVVIASGHFTPVARRAGLAAIDFGSDEDYLRLAGDPKLWHPRRGFATIARSVGVNLRRLYDLIAAEHEPGRTIAAATTLALAARIAQDKLGFPLASVHLQPSIFRSVAEPSDYGVPMPRSAWGRRLFFRLVDLVYFDRGYRGPVNRLRRELQLPPIAHIEPWWHSPLLTLGLFPAWYASPAPDWPAQVRLTGFPLYDEGDLHEPDPTLDAFLARGEAPVMFTWGSAMMHADEQFATAVAACARLGRRGLLVTRFADQLPGDLPAFVHHASYVPFGAVMPRCAAVVHHGGVGTVSQALAAGVPQLITPFSHDQPDNAARVRRLGAGASIRPARLSADVLAAALDKLLGEPQIVASARRCADRLRDRDSGIRMTCDLLEAMAQQKSPALA